MQTNEVIDCDPELGKRQVLNKNTENPNLHDIKAEQYIDYKIQLIHNQLKIAQERLDLYMKKLKTGVKNAGPFLDENHVMNLTIPFCDKLNNLLTTISRLPAQKSALFLINDILKAKINQKKLLDQNSRKNAKRDFDVICNYSKREEDKIHKTGHFYAQNEDLCYYLMDKCFKKTSSGVWDSFLRFDLKNYWNDIVSLNNTVNICGVGGGPASDVMGSMSYLLDFIGQNQIQTIPKFKVNVLDYSEKMWEKTSKDIVTQCAVETIDQISKDLKIKINPTEHFCLDFQHIDFTTVQTIKDERVRVTLSEANVITICWALNEAEMVIEFWREFFNLTKKAIVIFIDGKGDRLMILKDLLEAEFLRGSVEDGDENECKVEEEQRNMILEYFENPRRLIKLP